MAVKYLVGGPVLLLIGHVGGIDAVGRARFVISLTSNDLEMSFREDRANAINPRYNPRSLNDPDVWPTLLATADDE